MRSRFLVHFLLVVVTAYSSLAAPKDPFDQKDPDWVDDRINDVNHGGFFHYSFTLPNRKTPKGIAIRVGDKGQGTVCFDSLLCSYAGAWTGGFLKFSSRRFAFIGPPERHSDCTGPLSISSDWPPAIVAHPSTAPLQEFA